MSPRMRLTLLALLMFVALVSSAQSLKSADPPTRGAEAAEDLSKLSMDALIERLPTVGFGAAFDDKTHSFLTEPADAEMTRRLASGEKLSDAQWERALKRTKVVQVRAKWPVLEPLTVCMQGAGWLQLCEIRLRPKATAPGFHTLRCGTLDPGMKCGEEINSRIWGEMDQELPKMPLGIQRLEFDAEIERGDARERFSVIRAEQIGPPGIVWRGRITLEFEIVRTLAESVPPAARPELGAILRDGLAANTWSGQNGGTSTGVHFNTWVRPDSPLANTAVSATVELLRDGRVVSCGLLQLWHQEFMCRANGLSERWVHCWGGADTPVLSADTLNNEEERRRWNVRVTGTDRDVLKMWHAQTRWSGTVEIPLAALVEHEAAKVAGDSTICLCLTGPPTPQLDSPKQ